MSAHPLTVFTYETFGQQFGDLILAGYGAEPGGGRRVLYLAESEAGEETDWVIEFVASHPPCGDDPLVLAALLKLLLSRPNISNPFEFEMEELLAELRWPDDPEKYRHMDEVIVGYVSLLYNKRPNEQAMRRAAAVPEGGYYHLLTGYVRVSESGAGGYSARDRGVYFGTAFINGLKEGRVHFAGIDFGSLKMNR